MAQWFTNFLTNTLPNFVLKLIIASVIVVVGFILVKYLIKLIQKSKFFEKADPNVQSFITNFLSAAIKIMLVLIAVMILGVPEASIVAVIGSCGVAIGLALQGGLSNIASGIIIMVTKPFKVGNFVDSAAGTGVVKDIGIYYTKLTTPDNVDVTVPNSAICNATVKNLSAQDLRRVDFDFNVAYDTDLDLARKVLLASAQVNEKVLETPAPEVFVAAHGESAISLKLRIWCNSADYWGVYFDMWEDVKKAFDKFNIHIPYNHLDVTLVNPKED
ncbi:MAG: mechanosensitive ion channel family protein [Clostridia bacterium]|nr:mechanosensitive ion channel family protein [Clostridia bacterium]